jgi:hypothetical protein
MPDYPDEDVAAFVREHREAGYWSRRRVEQEMSIDDAARSLALAERYLAWLMILLDPEAGDELKSIAAEMIYLTGHIDAKFGQGLP